VRPFVTTLILLVCAVVAINSAASLARTRHEDRIHHAAAAFSPGQALTGYRDIDERRFQRARLVAIPRPRVVAFGSSRVMEVSTGMIGAQPGEFYNAGLSGGTVEDFIALWSVLEASGKTPEVALFAIDLGMFNLALDQVRWLVLADEVNRFERSRTGGAGMLPGGERALLTWYRAKELVSYSVLATAVRDVRRLGTRRELHGADLIRALDTQLVPEVEVAGRRAIRADGSLIYDRETVRSPVGAVREVARRYAAQDAAGLTNFRWNAERARRLELLWRDMIDRGVTVVAYLPPYHPVVWESLSANRAHAAAVRDSRAFVRSLAQRLGVTFTDALDPSSIPCDESEFYDGPHASAACTSRVVHRVVDKVPGLTRSRP
jgi:hypothetical protein